MKPSSLSPRLRSRSLLLMGSIPGFVVFLWRSPLIVVVTLSGRGRPVSSGAACESELQATLARGFRQRLDAAVVAIARAVEGDLLDAGGQSALGDQLADPGRGVGILAVLQALAHVGLHGGG